MSNKITRYSYGFSLFLCSLCPFTLYAAKPISLANTTFASIKNSFQLELPNPNGALPRVASPRDSLSRNSLKYIKENKGPNKTHIRMRQQYLGFPVYGGYAIFHNKKNEMNSNSTDMSGILYSGLEADLGNPRVDFVKNRNLALQHFRKQHPGEVKKEEIIPIVYINSNAKAFWAYKVSLLVVQPHAIPEKPTAILNAQDFNPFVEWNDMKTIHTPADGEGFGGNIGSKKIHYGVGAPFLKITRNKATGICFMENENVKVIDMAHDYDDSFKKTMQYKCRQVNNKRPNTFWTGYTLDGYDLENGGYSPSNDALYIGQVINQMYLEWFKLPPLTYLNKPMKLIMRVHYGQGYENAFWDGEQMTFGDGDTLLHPLVSLGVGAHEISHGFTEQHSNLVYYGQSGGINESFSDMAAQAAEFYSTSHNSWEIGNDIFKEGSGYKALRFMNQPSLDGNSIDNADQFYEGLNVHYSSGVYNRLFYLLANKPGWDTQKAFHVMVVANMNYWTPYTDYTQGACGILQAAKELGYSSNAIKESLQEVAINYEDSCGISSSVIMS